MNLALRHVATLLFEIIVAASTVVLSLLLADGWPFGVVTGRTGLLATLGVFFALVGLAPLPWPRSMWKVGAASFVLPLAIVGVLTWNYRAGLMRFNPHAWRFKLDYVASLENLPVGLIPGMSALLGLIARNRLGVRGARMAQ